MDPPRLADAHQLDKDELQVCQVQIPCTEKELETWLDRVDKSGQPKTFKAWIYQLRILPWILCPLLVCNLPITSVETVGKRISSYYSRWLGLPCNLSSAALFGRSNMLQLPFNNIAEESHTREALQYRDSGDPKVSSAGIDIRHSTSSLRQREVESTVSGQARGSGQSSGQWESSFCVSQYSKALGKEGAILSCRKHTQQWRKHTTVG